MHPPRAPTGRAGQRGPPASGGQRRELGEGLFETRRLDARPREAEGVRRAEEGAGRDEDAVRRREGLDLGAEIAAVGEREEAEQPAIRRAPARAAELSGPS